MIVFCCILPASNKARDDDDDDDVNSCLLFSGHSVERIYSLNCSDVLVVCLMTLFLPSLWCYFSCNYASVEVV